MKLTFKIIKFSRDGDFEPLQLVLPSNITIAKLMGKISQLLRESNPGESSFKFDTYYTSSEKSLKLGSESQQTLLKDYFLHIPEESVITLTIIPIEKRIPISPSDESDALNTLFGSKNEEVSNFKPYYGPYNRNYHGYVSNFTRERNCGFAGLINSGMTCYMNSLLHTLFMTPEFRNAIYNWKFEGSDEDAKTCIPYQLQRLFLRMQITNQASVSTTDLTTSFGWRSCDIFQQQDVHELCRVMFDALEVMWKKHSSDNTDFSSQSSCINTHNLINKLYGGKRVDYVRCLNCNNQSCREELFLDIQIPIKPFGINAKTFENLEEAFDSLLKPERLEGNNQYNCEQCKKKSDAERGSFFRELPYLLTLQLMRFTFDITTLNRIKLNDRFVFPLDSFDFNRFVAKSPECSKSSPAAGYSRRCSSTSSLSSPCSQDDDSSTDAQRHPSFLNDSGLNSRHMSPSNEEAKSEDSIKYQSNHTVTAETLSAFKEQLDLATGDPTDLRSQDSALAMSEEDPDRASSTESNKTEMSSDSQYLYELFSIMIHSGNSNGGHYYAYIKDFASGNWFNFNDQSVTRVCYSDLESTFGGKSHANAYFLIYRRIDPNNVSFLSQECFLDHIRKMADQIKHQEELEEAARKRESLQVYLEITTFCEKFIKIHLKAYKDQTMDIVAKAALKDPSLTSILGQNLQYRLVQLDCYLNQKYRLGYSSERVFRMKNRLLEHSFDSNFDFDQAVTLGDFLGSLSYSYYHFPHFYLEFRKPCSVSWPLYTEPACTISIFLLPESILSITYEEMLSGVHHFSLFTLVWLPFNASITQFGEYLTKNAYMNEYLNQVDLNKDLVFLALYEPNSEANRLDDYIVCIDPKNMNADVRLNDFLKKSLGFPSDSCGYLLNLYCLPLPKNLDLKKRECFIRRSSILLFYLQFVRHYYIDIPEIELVKLMNTIAELMLKPIDKIEELNNRDSLPSINKESSFYNNMHFQNAVTSFNSKVQPIKEENKYSKNETLAHQCCDICHNFKKLNLFNNGYSVINSVSKTYEIPIFDIPEGIIYPFLDLDVESNSLVSLNFVHIQILCRNAHQYFSSNMIKPIFREQFGFEKFHLNLSLVKCKESNYPRPSIEDSGNMEFRKLNVAFDIRDSQMFVVDLLVMDLEGLLQKQLQFNSYFERIIHQILPQPDDLSNSRPRIYWPFSLRIPSPSNLNVADFLNRLYVVLNLIFPNFNSIVSLKGLRLRNYGSNMKPMKEIGPSAILKSSIEFGITVLEISRTDFTKIILSKGWLPQLWPVLTLLWKPQEFRFENQYDQLDLQSLLNEYETAGERLVDNISYNDSNRLWHLVIRHILAKTEIKIENLQVTILLTPGIVDRYVLEHSPIYQPSGQCSTNVPILWYPVRQVKGSNEYGPNSGYLPTLQQGELIIYRDATQKAPEFSEQDLKKHDEIESEQIASMILPQIGIIRLAEQSRRLECYSTYSWISRLNNFKLKIDKRIARRQQEETKVLALPAPSECYQSGSKSQYGPQSRSYYSNISLNSSSHNLRIFTSEKMKEAQSLQPSNEKLI